MAVHFINEVTAIIFYVSISELKNTAIPFGTAVFFY